jgi:hypothetical protein
LFARSGSASVEPVRTRCHSISVHRRTRKRHIAATKDRSFIHTSPSRRRPPQIFRARLSSDLPSALIDGTGKLSPAGGHASADIPMVLLMCKPKSTRLLQCGGFIPSVYVKISMWPEHRNSADGGFCCQLAAATPFELDGLSL